VDERADEELMAVALAEARRGLDAGEVPVGAVVVVGGEIVASAHNAPITLSDPTAHAEVLALREAARKLGNYRLGSAILYATVEPCPMCCGAILHARLARVVYGATDPRAGAVESLYRLLDDARLNHRVATRGGVLGEDAARLLKTFFEAKR
jgi:tRNA(adenine34) deaminase